MMAGWLAALIMKRRHYEVRETFFDFFKIDISGMIVSLIMTTAGAILVLAIAGLINKSRYRFG
jgi:uncharacterized membrane protein YeaQ/YmgE (transglycosylase-associated protein family)